MAISYVSQPYESNPYVLPVDINLLASVNQYKQTEFYKNAGKIENQIAQINNSDIANPEQHAKMKGLVNNLTKQIDGMGAINYSDINVTNTLESYGQSIYEDEDVTAGIIGTKQVRQLQNNIEKLKTDPKLNKYYSPANEWDAMLKVNDYVNGGLKARYTGGTAPVPYKGNVFARLQDAVKKIMPDVEVKFGESGNPFFIEKVSHKTVDPNKVYAAIDGSVDGDLLKQIDIDARFNMRSMNADNVLQYAKTDYENRKKQLESQKDYYENALATEPNTMVKEELKLGLANTKQALAQVGATYDENTNRRLASTTEGLDALKLKIYSNKLFNDVVVAGTYKQDSKDLIVNQQEIWNKKLYLEQLKASYRATKGGKKNNATGLPEADTGFTDYGSNMQTDEEIQAHPVTVQDFKALSDDYHKQNQLDIRTFVEDLGKTQPDYADLLGIKSQVNTSSNGKRIESKSDILDKVAALDNDVNGISKEDLQKAGYVSQFNDKQKQFFQNLYDNFDKASTGKLDAVDFAGLKVDKKEFLNLVDRYSDRQMAADVNDRIINEVTKNTVDRITDPADKKLYQEYIASKDSTKWGKAYYGSTGGTGGAAGGYVKTKLGNKIDDIESKYNVSSKEIEKELNKGIYRENYLDFNLKNKKDLLDAGIDLQTRITGAVNHPDDISNPDDIQPQRVRRLPGKQDIWTMQYAYKNKNGDFKYSTPEQDIVLNEGDLAKLGIKPLPKPDLENYMKYNDISRPYFSYNEPMGSKGVFKYEIVNLAKGLNNPNFVIRFYNGNTTVPIKIGYGGQPFKSANEAYAFGQSITSPEVLKALNNDRDLFFKRLAENAWGSVNQ